jgi:hypothetical protein
MLARDRQVCKGENERVRGIESCDVKCRRMLQVIVSLLAYLLGQWSELEKSMLWCMGIRCKLTESAGKLQ